MELLVARNPNRDSSLPYLLWVPLEGGLVFRTKGTWPRTSALYCHAVGIDEWPAEPEIVERVALRACARRGAAIDVVCDRGREQRSQIVFTRARGREVVFWQSPRTRKQARPDVRLPTARAQGVADLEILVDSHERYPYTFASQQARTVRRGLSCGDYAVTVQGQIVAAVERKSVADLVSSLTSGRLRYALGELSALLRAAVVVEDHYGQIFAVEHVRGSVVADGLAITAHVAVLAARHDHDRVVLAGVAHPTVRGRVDPHHPAGADQVLGAVAEAKLDRPLVDEVHLLLLVVVMQSGGVARRQDDRVHAERGNTELLADLSKARAVAHLPQTGDGVAEL